MKIVADTNLLVRVITNDDEAQAEVARAELNDAEAVILPSVVLCELAWVLRKIYRHPANDIARAIRALIAGDTVVIDHGSVDTGLAILDAGGDFADGVIAHEGRRIGGEMFVSFDKEAVALVAAQGGAAKLLA